MKMFEPLDLGALTAANRVFFSACTRHRARLDEVPTPIMGEYYAQRSSAGLLITEGVSPTPRGRGYWNTPGLYSQAQQEGWTSITSAVHNGDGNVFAQLMHVGRISHESLQPDGMSPVSASSVRPDPDFRGYSFNCPVPKAPHPEPRELTTTEVETEIDAYVAATRRALAAGFDGVEIHAGSGYLPMQFLTSNTNLRTDRYGGSTAARSVFLLELVEALSSVDGAARVGIKLSPGFRFNDVHDADPVATYGHLFQQLRGSGIAYLQISDYGEYYGYEQQTPWLAIARDLYQGVLVANGGLGRDSGIDLIESGVVDAVAYGAFFISNPDLPERFLLNAPLNEPDVSTFYTQGTAGYTDYPRRDGDLPAHLAVTYTGIQTVQEAR